MRIKNDFLHGVCLLCFVIVIFITFQSSSVVGAESLESDSVITVEFKCKHKLTVTELEKTSKLVEEKYTEAIKSSGLATFKMPGKMNWEYHTPDNKKFISDSETVWFYEPQVNQVTVGELKKSFDTEVPAMFMLGIGKISETFNLLSGCDTTAGRLLVMSPKNQASSLKTLSLLVSKSTYVPIGARMTDVSDTINEFLFKDLVIDKEIVDSSFVFVPPSDSDIIYNN